MESFNPSSSYKCSCTPTVPSLVDSCFNYLNSGVPHRIMFYNQGTWLDFPNSVAKVLIDAFKNEKSSIKFSIGDEALLFDFLSMFVINLRTRKKRSVAWIDENNKCFFPTIFGHDDDGSKEWDFENTGNMPVRNEDARLDRSPPEVIKHVILSPERPVNIADALRLKLETLQMGTEGYISIQNRFLSGMGPLAQPGNIKFIHRYVPKDSNGQKRKETFERAMKLIEEERGDANVQYAWFGAKKLEMVRALIHGFGSFGRTTEGVFGTGLYLIPEGRTFSSVSICDVDEKGMQYMMLCRVILGKIEQIHPRSKQYCPSCGDYDSGVDSLSKPKCYIVWPSHINAYINPEYFVSFKLSPNVQEYLSGLKDIRYHLETSPAADFSTPCPVMSMPVKPPTSPWVPFKELLEQIREHVSPLVMELLVHHHQEHKNGVIDRDELVKKVKVLIGDQLLLSVLNRFKLEPSVWHEAHPAKRRKLNESATPHNSLNNENNSSAQPTPGSNGINR
ncbi:uncharacterized protein A4U43_C08F28780 [Asparagus officinalis]|uniref:probable inactive poly [ADP-ribose] polymerase SRO2 n=1 Tax=Asparagus officinalis TaxID=4686 RepID=UPI00098DE6AD|nr:probable inactive poly [ADP-ribose] polymerase SRO2 [Asparagus officinalis]XP_020241836.1 probable inactive poly [ADP-ribose] polymerase SRO2 [Asparagus officinalis]XP_020241837.1 probable inactive poly [ADP-ribose] polymerase SRO2 [Asparagus officinalis]XP_020241838.1 probable inactive poly [ADP-ribose] polymerase SRO2 [Asparagus officinalis]ONK61333.1 uncharacterized protein A4U43_C08F28780 [Asparagus officinalis]